ncbi:hypothetical protein EMCG_07322 [[Emmonsia] crescens]|uniref:Zn(2)-C6 fungal-type domain-containing protein n=1 Tax=[Emmonsia] crescens TaxID=73230 RepID=A0A0G2JB75_9EURO|nr:hypothetical protein EMCG_07322 [Emmonsia crescens UAMH 3008]
MVSSRPPVHGLCANKFQEPNLPPNSPGARQPTARSTRQRKWQHGKTSTACLTCRARHIRCDEAAPACRNCLTRGLHCDGAQNETPYKFVDPSQAASGFVKRQHKAFRGETDPAQENPSAPTQNDGVSSSHALPSKDPTSPCLHSVDLQGIHASAVSLAIDNPTTGDDKPPFQSTLNDEARDLQSYSSSDGPYSIGDADWYSDYPDIRGDVSRDDENVCLAFIVFISEPVLQEQLEYLKTHTFHLNCILRAFSEKRVGGPLTLPYALCLMKSLRYRPGQQLSVKRLNDTIDFLSTRLRGLLATTNLLYTHQGRISRVSLLLENRVFLRRLDLPGDLWQRSTVFGFILDDNLAVTLFLTNHPNFKVSDETWDRLNPLNSGIADVAAIFGIQ